MNLNIESRLSGIDKPSLIDYTISLIDKLVPDGKAKNFRQVIKNNFDDALDRTMVCVNRCRLWKPGVFNYLHSSQFCSFIYLLSNTIWHDSANADACTRLFLVNKALNGIDIFYQIDLPEPFFIGHSVGIVLARANFGRRLVLYQNSTIGKGGDYYPNIGDDVIVYPNCAIIGRCNVASGTVLSQGVSIINQDTPGHCIAFRGHDGILEFKNSKKNHIDTYFRSESEMADLLINAGN